MSNTHLYCSCIRVSVFRFLGMKALLVLLALAMSGLAVAESPVQVGLQKQLLVDDYVVAEIANVALELGKVTKENDGRPVMEPKGREHPLYFGVYLTVLRDQGKFRMWYLVNYRPDYDIGYAESQNGIHWTRPNVGQGGNNNFVFRGHGFSCSIDHHETDPTRRYKAAYGPAGNYTKDQKAAHLAYSPDGIRWTPYNNGRAVLERTLFPHPTIPGRSYVTAADTHSQIIWDEKAAVYRLFTRDLYLGPNEGTDQKVNRGSHGYTNPDVNADSTNWTTTSNWVFNREGLDEYKVRQIYALTDWIYEDVHFAQMSVFKLPEAFIDAFIATSRDSNSWNLSWVYAGRPMIPPGEPGSFDAAGAFPASQVVTWNDRHWLYYGAMDKGHKDPNNRMTIGLATLRLDGFVSLSAGDAPGTVTTKPFKVEGGKLEINVDASHPDSSFCVEVLDAKGRPISGFSKADYRSDERVDQLRFQPQWKNADFASLKDKVIRLRFHLRNADLYAFKISNQDI